MLRRVTTWLLFMTGALLLAKGSFSVLPSVLPFGQTEVPIIVAETAHGSRFSAGSSLFRLALPRLSAHFTVVEGTAEPSLRKGPGHLSGSPLPGTMGNVVVAGHRDTHFRVLKDVVIGDAITVDIAEKQLTYRVMDIQIVSPKDTWVLDSSTDPTLTLITCYPFHFLGAAPDRYIVQATLIKP